MIDTDLLRKTLSEITHSNRIELKFTPSALAGQYLVEHMLDAHVSDLIEIDPYDIGMLRAFKESGQWPETKDDKGFSFLLKKVDPKNIKKLFEGFHPNELEAVYMLSMSRSDFDDTETVVWKFPKTGEAETATCIFNNIDHNAENIIWENGQIFDDIKQYAEERIKGYLDGGIRFVGEGTELMRK